MLQEAAAVRRATLTVRELSGSTRLGGAELLAGRAGLDRAVARVQTMEVLDDYADYLARGDLLLTTGYNLRANSRLQAELIPALDRAGAEAVIVKEGYYLGEVPYALRAAADELALPLFALPRDVPFVELSESINAALLDRGAASLRRADAVHRTLVRLVVDGASLGELAARASDLCENPVVIEDATGTRLAVAGAAGRVRLAPLGIGEGTDVVLHRLRGGPLVMLAPIVSAGRRFGAVGLVGIRPLDPDDELALMRVAQVAALELVRGEQLRVAEARLASDLVRDAVRGTSTPTALRDRAADLAIDLDDARLVLAVGVAEPDVVVADAPARRRLLVDALHGEARAAMGSDALLAHEPDGLVVLLPAEAEGGVADACRELVSALTARAPGAGCAAGWSIADSLGRLPAAYAEARRAQAIGRALDPTGGAHAFREVAIYDVLLGGRSPERAGELAERILGRLTPALRTTLETFCRQNLSVADTAAVLYVHRNTVRYRLGRVQALTGLRLAVFEERLLLELGLIAARLGST